MSLSAFTTWVFALVALAIAVTGFAVAQFVAGGGMVFVLAATTAWVAFVHSRQRKMTKKSNG